MIYDKTKSGVFLSRPNRFIAHVSVDGVDTVCHVKNTGRCKEILVPGTKVILEASSNPKRKTPYSLVAAYKDDMLINIDSQAPNKVVFEWLKRGDCISGLKYIKPEYTYGKSRLDFYAETDGERHLIEVKGVTLENKGKMSFPDAPTQRGTRHIGELINSMKDGYIPHIFFVVQLNTADSFSANRSNDPAFADALRLAIKSGVDVRVVCCKVEEDSMEIPLQFSLLNVVSN